MSYYRTHNKGTSSECKRYYKDKKCTILHREDGPAVEYAKYGNQWWANGERHIEDGPAIEWSYGKLRRFFSHECEYSEEEYWEEVAKIKFGVFI